MTDNAYTQKLKVKKDVIAFLKANDFLILEDKKSNDPFAIDFLCYDKNSKKPVEVGYCYRTDWWGESFNVKGKLFDNTIHIPARIDKMFSENKDGFYLLINNNVTHYIFIPKEKLLKSRKFKTPTPWGRVEDFSVLPNKNFLPNPLNKKLQTQQTTTTTHQPKLFSDNE
jgi:hypothetical protein